MNVKKLLKQYPKKNKMYESLKRDLDVLHYFLMLSIGMLGLSVIGMVYSMHFFIMEIMAIYLLAFYLCTIPLTISICFLYAFYNAYTQEWTI